MEYGLTPFEWREKVRSTLSGEFVPLELCCLEYPNDVSPWGYNCGGLGVAYGHLAVYSNVLKHFADESRIIEVGGGSGFSSRLYFLATGAETWHTDWKEENIAYAELMHPCPGVTRRVWDITQEPSYEFGVFSSIVMTEVLEHIPFEMWDIVKENIYMLSDKDTKLILSFPVAEDLTIEGRSAFHTTSIPSKEFVVDFFSEVDVRLVCFP